MLIENESEHLEASQVTLVVKKSLPTVQEMLDPWRRV